MRNKKYKFGKWWMLGLILSLMAMALPAYSTPLDSTSKADSTLHGPAKGIYWMVSLPADSQEKRMVERVLADNECLNGIFIRTNWNQIEPVKGKYDWEQLDWAIRQAREQGLQYKVMLLPGMHTPRWVYDEGAEAFSTTFPWPMRSEYGEPTQIPLPWDPIYQRYFRRFIKNFAGRYKQDDHFVALTLTGVNFVYGEMHLPKTDADIKKWETYPNYTGRIENTYKDLIDFYGELFPQQQMVLHITMPVRGMGENVKNIISYGIQNYPNQFTLQNAQLTGHQNNRGMFSYRMILKYNDKAHVGFQSLNSFVNFKKRVGPPEVATYNFVKAGGEYWELLKPDGKSSKFTCRLADMIATARAKGAEQYRQELQAKGEFTHAFAEKREQMRKYEDKGNYDKAIAIMNETFRFIRWDIGKKVELLQKADRPDEAISFLYAILERRNTAAFYELLVDVYLEEGSFKKAANSLEKAYQLSNNNKYLIQKGQVYAENKQKNKAIRTFERFIETDKHAKTAYERVAELYQSNGYVDALQKLKVEAKDSGYEI